MEKIKLYQVEVKKTKRLSYLNISLIIIVVFMILLSIFGEHEFSLITMSLVLLGQVLAYVSNSILLQKSNCFIGWDDSQLQYLLPKQKKIKTIQISEINDLVIHPRVIVVSTSSEEINLKLDEVPSIELRKLKEKFEEIKATIR